MKNKKQKASYYIILSILALLLTSDNNVNDDYKNIKLINNPHSFSVLVNKNNQLLSSYIPNDLVPISNLYANENKLVRKKVKHAFENLSHKASKIGYRIVVVSAYRSYDYQKKLFDYYIEEKGLDYALKCSARPGFSEHQTGLAIDVEGSNRDYDHFDDSVEFDWMKNNAHLFGFIMRYPKNKEKITGFKYEPWHYRYVGVKVATYIYKNNLTLEEYLKEKVA